MGFYPKRHGRVQAPRWAKETRETPLLWPRFSMNADSDRSGRHQRRGLPRLWRGGAEGGMGKPRPSVADRAFCTGPEEPHRPSSVDKIPLAMLCRGSSGPPETLRWEPMKNHCVNGFAGGSAVAGCSGSAGIVTGATNTAVTAAGRRRARYKSGPPDGNTSTARRDGTITATGTGPTGHAAGSGA